MYKAEATKLILKDKKTFILFLLIFAMVFSACNYNSGERPEGWTEETHSSDATPNYNIVFTQDEVKRIDITISSFNWNLMLWDLTSLIGLLGWTSNLQFPLQMEEACEEKQFADNCSGNIGPFDFDGICVSLDDGPLLCAPVNDVIEDPTLIDREPLFSPCTVAFENKTWQHVGIRFKGNSSLALPWGSGSMKLPFSLNFDKFEDQYPEIDDQRFFGFDKLSLCNNSRDDSLLREKVTGDLFRAAGVPAPRTAFYRLYIDFGNGPFYFGLYTMTERPEKPMFETQFNTSTNGNLYKPEGPGAHWTVFDEEFFEKKTNEEDADWSDVKSAIDALNASQDNATAWRAGLEKVFNVHGFIKWLAVNTIIQNWDTYGNMTHNYYLYTNPGDNLIHWIPWDNNEALKSTSGVLAPLLLDLKNVDDSWPLIRFLMDDIKYHAVYISYLKEVIEAIYDVESMQTRFEKEHKLIEPYVTGLEGEEEGYTLLKDTIDFHTALEELNEHVVKRNKDVLEFLQNN